MKLRWLNCEQCKDVIICNSTLSHQNLLENPARHQLVYDVALKMKGFPIDHYPNDSIQTLGFSL